jgi:hypothetical protein
MAQKTRLRNSNILLFYNNCFQTWSEWITTTEARQKVGNYIGENLSLDHTIIFWYNPLNHSLNRHIGIFDKLKNFFFQDLEVLWL